MAAKSGTGLSMISGCCRYGLGTPGITEGISYDCLLRVLVREHADGEYAGGLVAKAIGEVAADQSKTPFVTLMMDGSSRSASSWPLEIQLTSFRGSVSLSN